MVLGDLLTLHKYHRLDEMAESALKLAKSLKSDVDLSKAEISKDNVKFKAKILPSTVSLDEKKGSYAGC